jgi:hypothetical protein
MRAPAYVMGALATIALGIFGGYASIHFSLALWMARIAIIFYALATCLFLQDVQWERLAPGEARSFSPKIWCTSLLMMLVGLGLSFTLPYPAPLSPPSAPVPALTPPRFRERVDRAYFSLGEGGGTAAFSLAELQERPWEPFIFGGDKPVRIYAEERNIYADFTVWDGVGQSLIEVRRNEFMVRPSRGDRNSNQNALEVVNTNNMPIFQMIYKTESHIVVNGVFPIPGGIAIADQFGFRSERWERISQLKPLSIKRIFKYPSWKYPGQLE